MKRRLFLTTTGLTGVGIGSGLAATGSMLFSNAPWRVFPNLSVKDIGHLDSFAKELATNYKSHNADLSLVKKVLAPSEIISKKESNSTYHLVYKNTSGKYVTIMKKKGQVIASIHDKLPKTPMNLI